MPRQAWHVASIACFDHGQRRNLNRHTTTGRSRGGPTGQKAKVVVVGQTALSISCGVISTSQMVLNSRPKASPPSANKSAPRLGRPSPNASRPLAPSNPAPRGRWIRPCCSRKGSITSSSASRDSDSAWAEHRSNPDRSALINFSAIRRNSGGPRPSSHS